MKKLLTTGLFICGFLGSSWAQSIHGNLPSFTTQYLQPAALGFADYAGVYAFQRNEEVVSEVGFSTTQVSLQYPFFKPNTTIRYGTVGFSFIRDASRLNAAPYRQSAFELTYAYSLALGNGHEVSAGVSGGYHTRRLGFENLRTASQWVQYQGLDESLATGENITDFQRGFATFNASLGYQYRDEQGQPLVRAVFSGFKLNQPNEAFLTTGVSISGIRWTGAASVRAFEAGNFAIIPELYGELQGQNYLANLGVAFDWVFQNENPFDPIQDGSIRLATRYTQANVVVLALQIDQPQYQIGFAYDLGVGGNVPRTYQSAFEVGLSFRVNRRPQANAVFVTDYSLGEIRDFYDEEGGQAVPVAGSEERPANANSQRDEEPDERGFFRNPDPVLGDEEGAEVDRSAYTFTLEENFNFGFNEAVLDETAKNRIRQINDLLVSTPNLRLEVVGHTDNVGTRAGNMEVSRRRAQAVKDYLVELGIDPRRVRIVAKGDSSPKYPNDTPLNRSRNRRVEFVISSGG